MARTVVTQPLLLGHAIKSARRARGITQVALAAAVGTYPRAIVEIERGKSKADVRLLLAVLAAVDLTMVVESQ
jgi:DNA-binding XRE family transcriptional regulator